MSALDVNKVINAAIKGGNKKAPLVKYVKTFQCKKAGNKNNIESASFLTYHDNTLWVGICKEKEDAGSYSTLYGYRISYTNGKPSALNLERSWPIPLHANGAVFVDDYSYTYLIVSSQTGRKHDSSLVCFKAHDDGTKCVFEKQKTVKLPPMLEDLCISNGRFYSIYESAAKPYKDDKKNKLKGNAYMNEICISNTYTILDMLIAD